MADDFFELPEDFLPEEEAWEGLSTALHWVRMRLATVQEHVDRSWWTFLATQTAEEEDERKHLDESEVMGADANSHWLALIVDTLEAVRNTFGAELFEPCSTMEYAMVAAIAESLIDHAVGAGYKASFLIALLDDFERVEAHADYRSIEYAYEEVGLRALATGRSPTSDGLPHLFFGLAIEDEFADGIASRTTG